TLDKLESIPGFRAELTVAEFKRQLKEVGLVVAGQSADLAPADGKFYALRDVTATVSSIPLIASSIMSKKIAAGANVIVLDVKVGQGAFVKDEEQAVQLARLMIRIGQSAGRRVAAIVSDMNQPLGCAVGNALEVREALETLQGRGPDDFVSLVRTVAGWMLFLSGRASSPEEGQALADAALASGQALAKFRAFVEAQGGDPRYVDNPDLLPKARFVRTVLAPRSGYIVALNAEEVGMAAVLLGAGRNKKGDPIDHAVGIVLNAKVGARVEDGDPLFTVHANDGQALEEATQRVLEAYTWSDEPVQPPPLIKQVVSTG
ncbi:MAG: thymidine phosphorylase, partial [Anaerolineae bacterium]